MPHTTSKTRPTPVASQSAAETGRRASAKRSSGGVTTPRLAQLAAVVSSGSAAASAAPVQRSENRTGLPDTLKSGVESLSGLSLDHVRVHRNSSQPAQLGAHAFAQGSDIHVAPGQEKHLAHEAWHVVQQAQGRVQPTRQLKAAVAINDDASLEKEADVMGARAARVGSAETAGATQLRRRAVAPAVAQPVVQRFPAPGVGIELESNTIKLRSERWESDDPRRLGGHELKGQSIYPNEAIARFIETTMWSLTAESTGYNPRADIRQLAVEIIVHGGGARKGVKLRPDNVGILRAIALNIQRHMTYWQDHWTVTPELGGRHWTIVGHANILGSIWGLQATSAVPLPALHRLLGAGGAVETGDGAPHAHAAAAAAAAAPESTALIPPSRMPAMVHVTAHDFSDLPDASAIANDPSLLAVLSLILSYAKGAASMTPAHPGVKHTTPVMPRTNFVGMIRALPPAVLHALMGDKGTLFVAMVRHACRKKGVSDSGTFYWRGEADAAPTFEAWRATQRPMPDVVARSVYESTVAAAPVTLTVPHWIEGLVGGRDRMAELDRSNRHGQIGGIGETVEGAIDNPDAPAPVFEFRDLGSTTLQDAPATFERIERAVRRILTTGHV